jgi:hypothetical protein
MRKMEKQLRNLFTILLSASIIMAFANPQLNAQGVAGKQKKQTERKGILAQTPPLGYNSFDSYGINIYEEVAMKEIDAFIENSVKHRKKLLSRSGRFLLRQS